MVASWQNNSSDYRSSLVARGHEKLFEVVIEHDYYQGGPSGGRCSDFDVFPNVRSVSLMRKLGLLFRSERASFSVFYDVSRRKSLLHYLANNKVGAEPWTYLSFFLANHNPKFVNLTDIPFDLSPLQRNYYFRNDEVGSLSGDPSSAILERRAGNPFRVKPAHFRVHIPPGGKAVILTASGTEVVSVDRASVPAPLGPPFYVDLSQEFEGLYILSVRNRQGQEREKLPFIYTLAQPAPLCYMHVLLNKPKDGEDLLGHPPGGMEKGVYPVDLANEEAPLTFRRYVVKFGARRTRWVYHVVTRSPEIISSFRKMKIEGASTPAFQGPDHEPLPGGRPSGDARAYRFKSTSDLPLERRSNVRLKLRMDDRILVDRLPVAAVDQVLSRDAQEQICSDIYVYV